MPQANFIVENYLRELQLIYFTRQRLILTITAIIFAIATAIAFLAPPLYSSNATILVRSSGSQRIPEALANDEGRVFKTSEDDLRSEIELLRSISVIQAAINKLISEHYPNADQLVWLEIQQRLKAVIAPKSRVISIELKWYDKKRVIDILNAIMDEYILRRSEINYPESVKNFFTSQLDRFYRQIEKNKQSLSELATITRTPDPIKEIDKNLISKQRLEQLLDTLVTDEAALLEQIKHLKQVLETDEIGHFAFLRNETISAMASRLIDLEVERGKAARHYADDAKMVAVIDKQIRDTSNQIRREVEAYCNRLESDLSSNLEQQKILRSRIDSIEDRNLQLYSQSLSTSRLNRETELIDQSMDTFFKKNEEAEININNNSVASQFYVSIVNRAYSTGDPVFPNRPLVLIFGLLGGFITGFSIGFIIEFFDHRFKNARDVEQYSGLPLLFSVPLMNENCVRQRHD